MGGKAAMVLALRHPELVERLCVVDVVAGGLRAARSEFAGYIDAMQGLDLTALERRADADAALAEAVPNPTVRSFLLQNLRRDDDGWRWQANLDVLGRDLDELGGWPEEALAGTAPYDGPTLWVARRRRRGYVRDEYAAAMDRWFPRNRRVTVKGAGHWVHSEQPEVFLEVLRRSWPDGRPRSAGGPGRPRRRCGCRTRSSRSGASGCGTGRARRRWQVVVGADAEAGHLVGADHVDHRHRGLDRRSASGSGALGRRPRAGASPTGRGAPAGGPPRRSASISLTIPTAVVAVGGEQLRAGAGRSARTRVQLGAVAVVPAGVAELARRTRRGRPTVVSVSGSTAELASATAACSDTSVS